jgi:hypothetical protein
LASFGDFTLKMPVWAIHVEDAAERRLAASWQRRTVGSPIRAG